MAIETKDVIFVEDSEGSLSGIIKPGMFAFGVDTDRIGYKKKSDSTMRFYSDDTKQVLLASEQTITDIKTFNADVKIKLAKKIIFGDTETFEISKIGTGAGAYLLMKAIAASTDLEFDTTSGNIRLKSTGNININLKDLSTDFDKTNNFNAGVNIKLANKLILGDTETFEISKIGTGGSSKLLLKAIATGTQIEIDTTSGDVILKSYGSTHISLFENNTDFAKNVNALKNIEIRGQAYSPINTLTDDPTIATDCDLGNVHQVEIEDDRALGLPTNLKAGATYIWIITQGTTGEHTLSYNGVFRFPGGTLPVLSIGIADIDILTGVYDGSFLHCNLVKDFS